MNDDRTPLYDATTGVDWGKPTHPPGEVPESTWPIVALMVATVLGAIIVLFCL